MERIWIGKFGFLNLEKIKREIAACAVRDGLFTCFVEL